jgi:hypothetical protein
MRSGLSCASAGADIFGVAAAMIAVPAEKENSRRVSFMRASRY